MRGETVAVTYCWLFVELSSTYVDYMVIYTDGSFVQGSAECAFVYEGQVFKYQRHIFNSMYTADLHAICQALLFTFWQQSQQRYLLCTDSLSAL
jgi:hypothetical protein